MVEHLFNLPGPGFILSTGVGGGVGKGMEECWGRSAIEGSSSVHEALGWVASTWGKGGGVMKQCEPVEPDTERQIKRNELS